MCETPAFSPAFHRRRYDAKVENVLEATHLVAGGSGVPLKRTPKLLAGLGRCSFVLDVDWLYRSSKEGEVLDGWEYVLSDVEV